MDVPYWECTPGFDPLNVAKSSVRWVQWDGSPINVAQGMTEENVHISPLFCKAVADGEVLGKISMLSFRDPYAFIAETCMLIYLFGNLSLRLILVIFLLQF